jgi:transcriptional antiterminator NusG
MLKNWYVVHVYSGFEERVKTSIEEGVQRKGLQDMIGRILIPSEMVVELKKGEKKETQKKFYPGYILVEMALTDDTWHLIKNTAKVTGFVGGKMPIPLPQEEVDAILEQIEHGVFPQVQVQFVEGDKVRIKEGPFCNFTGLVDEIDKDRERLKVMVSIFGRQTPVELNFLQVEKE